MKTVNPSICAKYLYSEDNTNNLSMIFLEYTVTLLPVVFIRYEKHLHKFSERWAQQIRALIVFSDVGYFLFCQQLWVIVLSEKCWQSLPSPRAHGLHTEVGRALSDMSDTSHQHLLIYDSPGLQLRDWEAVCMYECMWMWEREEAVQTKITVKISLLLYKL